jgi:hypothetical protein
VEEEDRVKRLVEKERGTERQRAGERVGGAAQS